MAKVIFLHLSVIHSVHRGRGGLPQCMLGYPPRSRPPGADTPPGSRHPHSRHPPGNRHPQEQTPTPAADTHPGSRHPRSRHLPPSRHPPRSKLRHTVNEQPVRILLKCILVVHKPYPEIDDDNLKSTV